MKGWKKLTVGAAAILAIGGLVLFVRPDIYHTRERRAAKEEMIRSINSDLSRTSAPVRPADGEWMDAKGIFNEDGSWLAYRSRCHKQDPKVYDLFIAKASDGRWYYSTYHFCIDAIVLDMNGRPSSLEDFRKDYSLVEFDGRSDEALKPTWPESALE
jgi:hypothetical protein